MTHQERDDERRCRLGVSVSLVFNEEGRLRLVVDDIELKDATPTEWRKRCLFTYFDVDRTAAMEYRLEQEVYAGIGDALLARLLALHSLEEETPISPAPPEEP